MVVDACCAGGVVRCRARNPPAVGVRRDQQGMVDDGGDMVESSGEWRVEGMRRDGVDGWIPAPEKLL